MLYVPETVPEPNSFPGERELATFIEALPGFENETVHVYSWLDKFGGYRISELSLSHNTERGMGGSSWMQSDPECANVLFAAERFVVSRGDPIDDFGEDHYIDYAQEQEWSLRQALKVPDVPWEDRREK